MDMNSNFEFLSIKWSELYEVALSAERNVLADPNASLIKLRLFGELVTKYVMTYEGITGHNRTNQKERINSLLKEGNITYEVYKMLDSLRIKGNKAVHETNYGSAMESKEMLKMAFYLAAWLNQVYGQWDFELSQYKEAALVSVNVIHSEFITKERPITYNNIPNSSAVNVRSFSNQDEEYEKWLKKNGSGFVFNHFGGKESSKDMNKIHQASCRFLHRIQDAGKRTTVYPKVCSTELEDLLSHVGKLRGSSWVYCKSCQK